MTRVGTEIPKDGALDSSLALLSEGYEFIPNRCKRHNSDIVEIRLALQKAYCVTGADAAAMFYHPGRFTREGALPPTTVRLLQDVGSVHALDGEPHRHRKQLFVSLMTPESIEQLVQIADQEWSAHIKKWTGMEEVILHKEARHVITRAVCKWAGIPLTESEAEKRTREFGAMIDGAGTPGPRQAKDLVLRSRTESWGRDWIDAIRAGRHAVEPETAAYAVAWHRDLEGNLLDTDIASVELINFLRPTVAVARYVTFAAVALYENPALRENLRSGTDDVAERFTQEVRRYYPFFPAVAGRALHPFEWHEHQFEKGAWFLLDIYGTNHDPRTWESPDIFEPERFRHWDESPYNFIPQGGGDIHTSHRCPGERITIELTKAAAKLLASLQYEVPRQDLSIDLSKMPALPASGFVMRSVMEA
jgi:fatty-acid peroxygenase